MAAMNPFRGPLPAALALALMAATLPAADTVRVAAYNVESYLLQPTDSRPAKSPESRAVVRETIRTMHPDVLALEEIGSTNALLELRDSLKADGLDLPYWEFVEGYDTNIHVAVLSRFPFAARRSHPDDTFLLDGRRFRTSRGFAELDIQVTPSFTFTLLAAHLKSRRTAVEADESDLRLQEARCLRQHIDARFAADPAAPLVVLGDFNDTYNSRPVKELISRGKYKLVDLRPAEHNGDDQPNPENPRFSPRSITWTHYYGVEDTYARIDYILASPAMARRVVRAQTYIPALANWGLASDHRPVLATFTVTGDP
jgi:endonuclease/exonuclease/phosphatase family metal-dependent hydrolase